MSSLPLQQNFFIVIVIAIVLWYVSLTTQSGNVWCMILATSTIHVYDTSKRYFIPCVVLVESHVADCSLPACLMCPTQQKITKDNDCTLKKHLLTIRCFLEIKRNLLESDCCDYTIVFYYMEKNSVALRLIWNEIISSTSNIITKFVIDPLEYWRCHLQCSEQYNRTLQTIVIM